MSFDYEKHDARITSLVTYGDHPPERRFGWECIICRADQGRFRYTTGAKAKAGAERHNNGPYNEVVPKEDGYVAYPLVIGLAMVIVLAMLFAHVVAALKVALP